MFSRALTLYNIRTQDNSSSRHIVSVRSTGGRPDIRVYDATAGEFSCVQVDPVEWFISQEVMCIGRFEGQTYIPCPHRHRVSDHRICQTCAAPIFPYLECIWEPKCEGEICNAKFCTRPHAVYLAFFSSNPKIGMTSLDRLHERIVEQGADGYALIASVKNRYRARRLERSISDLLDVRQLYKTDELLPLFTEPPDYQRMASVYDSIADRIIELFDLEIGPLQTVELYEFTPLPEIPTPVHTAGRHLGDYLGAKGRFLFYVSDRIRALNIKDLEGRFLLDVL